ncbi:MAG: efflux transporter outer membrane subunit [Proteobacteria bacterium]|nr:efflux transporter outer membrane subunit [Pseudomonadota bacterium]
MVISVRGIKLLVVMGASALAGCAAVPKLGPKPMPASISSMSAEQVLGGGRAAWPAADWWTGFGDAQLSQLIAEALAGSPDVALAAARVRAADALAQQAGAALLPSLTVDASVAANKQSYYQGPPPQFIPKGINDSGRIAGNFLFDLDLWGKNRAALAAATSDAQAAAVDAEQAKLMLSTSVASAYADLAAYYARRNVAEEAVRVRAATAELTARRVANGLDTRGEQRQAESRVPAARADVAALDEAIALTRNRIAALLGAGPDRGLAIARPQAVVPSAGLPDRIALDLVGRRPDIVAARLRTEAAASRIKVARADFYPNFNLSAVGGLQALNLDDLFRGGASFLNAGPALSLPIFRGGAISGAYRGARANYDEAVARYNGTLVTALREAADATTSLRALDIQLTEQRQALAAAEEAARIARIRYQGGLANQLSALQADDMMLAVRRAVADTEARRFALNIALIRALGGGFQDTTPRLAGTR